MIAIDRVPARLELARTIGRAEIINFELENVIERLSEMTNGRGPDRCIDAVGAEAHSAVYAQELLDDAKEALRVPSNHAYALSQAIMCCRKAGTVSIPGVYTGPLNGFPMHAAMNKGLTLKMGQTNMQHYMKPLLKRIVDGSIDPSFVITHRGNLEDAPELYKTFDGRKNGCVKVVLIP